MNLKWIILLLQKVRLVRVLLLAGLVSSAGFALAGPKGEITVRPLGGSRIKVDGDISDWPLDKFKKVAEQPVFPGGQNAASTTAKGDHIVFDRSRIGRFNGTTPDAFQAGDSDFGSTIYFAHDGRFLYLLAVFIDDKLRDDRDTSEHGSNGFFNDGFEFFIDGKGDSADCISDDGFPNVDQAEPNTDDFQVTVALNAKFKPAGAGADILGARQTVERGGNPDLIGADKGGPGGIYRDVLTTYANPDIAARSYADLRAAGARNPEIIAKPNVKYTGYVIEMRIPMGNRIPELNMGRSVGYEFFWRDVDNIADDPGGKDVGAGGGDISWATWAQSTDVSCTDPAKALFNSANWGRLVFDKTDLLTPIPPGKGVLFIASNGEAPINADPAIISFIEANGYVVTSFTSGVPPEDLRAATRGQSVVLISETIGSTSVLDPVGNGTGVFSLKDSNIPIISFEAFMYDNADWVKRTEDGSNDWINWGNSGRGEVAETPINNGRDSLFIRKADHPIAKGLTGKVKVYNELYSLNFGLPSPDADVVASIQDDGTFPTIFVYEKGDKLVDGSVAPNKRIGFFFGQNAAPDFNTALNFDNVASVGRTLLLNTLAFAIGDTGTTPPADTASGLLGYWRMDETSGTVVSDSSGKGNNGAIVNSPTGTWVTDAERGAVYKATGTAVINFGVLIPAMTTANDFTWSLWLKSDETATATTPNNNIVFGNRFNTSGTDFNPREFIKFTPSNFEWHFNGAGQNVNYTDFVVGQWTHHVVVKQGTKLTYYRNGVEGNVGTITGGPRNPQPLYLGGQGTQERWRGAADEVAIYTRALTSVDVKQAYDLGKSGQPLKPVPPPGGGTAAEPVGIGSIKVEGANLILNWTGGKAPFQVQRRDQVASGAWNNVGAPTNERTASVPRSGAAGFYRISGQ